VCTFCHAHTLAIALPSCTLQTVPPTPSLLPLYARQLRALDADLNEWTCAYVARSCSWIAGVELALELEDADAVEHVERMISCGTIVVKVDG